MATIELYGREVIPRVRAVLAATPNTGDGRDLTAQARTLLVAD
jgi:hypothetical protein